MNRLGGLHDFDRDQIPGTPLMDAVFLCEPNPGSCAAERTIIDMLIRAGADPNIASADSFTPLHMLQFGDTGTLFLFCLPPAPR